MNRDGSPVGRGRVLVIYGHGLHHVAIIIRECTPVANSTPHAHVQMCGRWSPLQCSPARVQDYVYPYSAKRESLAHHLTERVLVHAPSQCRSRTLWAPRKKSVKADLVAQEVAREEKLPLVQSDAADHEVDLDMEW